MKSFLFANVPLSIVHFVLFVIFGGFLGQPGATVAGAIGSHGEKIDLSLVSAAAAAHDIGKYGCRPGENVPHLHYYYTGYWLENRDLAEISHIAANHSTWDLELDALPAESLDSSAEGRGGAGGHGGCGVGAERANGDPLPARRAARL